VSNEIKLTELRDEVERIASRVESIGKDDTIDRETKRNCAQAIKRLCSAVVSARRTP